MRIAEIFHSIQGEGRLAGVPSVFIRTSGCNLRCAWCDTPYTSWNPEGDDLTVYEILDRVRQYDCKHVVLTGGEPMLWPDVTQLTAKLSAEGRHTTIETAATVFRDVTCDLASISPKLSNSTPTSADEKLAQRHESDRLNLSVIRRFMDTFDYQLKFVVDTPADLAEIDDLLTNLPNARPQYVLLMPQGVTAQELSNRSVWLADICRNRGFRFCPRMHIMLYGNARGT